MHIAEGERWPAGSRPQAADGLRTQAFARGLGHPRWLCVLPNGDVPAAETDAPPKPDDGGGIKAWVRKQVMNKAGSGHPSANRITVLRDTDGNGVADTRSVLIDNVNSPFGMALVGDTLYGAATDAVLAYPYTAGATRIDAAPKRLTELPAGSINHHWTKNIVVSPDGATLYVTVGSNSNIGENGMAAEAGRCVREGMFVGQHGSWNRKPRSGYKVIFMPFVQGQPAGLPVDVVTGYVDGDAA